MATIKWNKRARLLFVGHIDYAFHEFGATTAARWFARKKKIEDSISKFPESFPREPLLLDRCRIYRRAALMKNFKLIYVYYPSSDTVRIVDIWDMRMNPETLKSHIKP